MTGDLPLERIRATLLEAADAAARETLPLFRTDMAVDNKHEKGFDPVTAADRNAEQAIRETIAGHFPDHAIIGEEWADKTSESAFTWIIDPVDGTRAFVSGVPVWGTLIGVTHAGRAFAGVMSQPFTGETFIAVGASADYMRGRTVRPLRARRTARLAEATLFTTTPALFTGPGQHEAFAAVETAARLTRYGCDCYAYALLAAGHVDLVIEPRMNSYDIAALVPLIESAGGVVTTWTGERAEHGGDIIAAATPELRDEALEAMRRHLPA